MSPTQQLGKKAIFRGALMYVVNSPECLIVTVQLTRKLRVHNPDFLGEIRLCPQNLLKSTNNRGFLSHAERLQ